MSDAPRTFRILPVHIILVLAVLTLGLGLYSAMLHTGGHKPSTGRESWKLENLKALGDAMRAYAAEHGGRYPEGVTSTEVFNVLIAEGYLEDHRVALDGGIDKSNLFAVVAGTGEEDETNPETTRLKGPGVAWDATAGLDADTPADVPLLYTTGFDVTYAPGRRPIPQAGTEERLVMVYTHGGRKLIFRLDDEENWEFPVMPESLPAENSLRQLRPEAE